MTANYRAFVWYRDTDIDLDSFVGVHGKTKEELEQKIQKEKEWMASQDYPYLYTEVVA